MCFGWNKPSWGNTEHQKYLGVLLKLWSVSTLNEISFYKEDMILKQLYSDTDLKL